MQGNSSFGRKSSKFCLQLGEVAVEFCLAKSIARNYIEHRIDTQLEFLFFGSAKQV